MPAYETLPVNGTFVLAVQASIDKLCHELLPVFLSPNSLRAFARG
ncbi:hypothetical protein VSAK1_00255 [Vibrio mediterranei AK1]|nr:hypothetical protein VSAK1_00255 [Vibrio mediterranei AK1]